MQLPTTTDTVVVGAGHAGLTMSWFLGQAGQDHVVLEREATRRGSWHRRWDSFRLVSPNWMASFPEASYDGADPDGFMPRDEIDARVSAFAEKSRAPIVGGTEVQQLTSGNGGGFRLVTTQGEITADSVVVATGSFHIPRIPVVAADFPAKILQMHTHEYRSPERLPPGGVLVVGSGQSGCQITEELAEAGRDVHLSVGSAGRVPRRYRGRDIFAWLALLASRGAALGVPFPTADQLPDIRMRSAANPQLSGHHGGHEINLRQLATDGVVLLGRIERVTGGRLELAPDLPAKLAQADAFFGQRFQPLIDRLIEVAGIDAPPDDGSPVTHEPAQLETLDLERAGISTVIWATGYGLDHGWIDLPIADEHGFPRQHRGVAEVPGLYFIGLLWQHTQASATLFGPRLDAAYLVERMGLPVAELPPPAALA